MKRDASVAAPAVTRYQPLSLRGTAMFWMRYSRANAERDIAAALARRPDGAASCEWTATAMQAGVSSFKGGWRDASGRWLDDDDGSERAEGAIRKAVERLEAAGAVSRWNIATVRWAGPGTKFVLTTTFDPGIVPRPPDDPIYERAAATRRAFWRGVGEVGPYLAETTGANAHNQTKWFGPHRRIIQIRRSTGLLLATDGLSTPWAGIADPENGVGCEVCLVVQAVDASAAMWADMLIAIGDVIADGYRVAEDIATTGPLIGVPLAPAFALAVRVVLSLDDAPAVEPARIEGLPFGPVVLLTATPVTQAELDALDPAGDDLTDALRALVRRRGS